MLELEVAGGGYGGGGGFAGAGDRDAGALEVGQVDVGGRAGAAGRVQGRDVLRPLLVVGDDRGQLGHEVGTDIAGDITRRQRREPDQPATAGPDRLRVALGLLVDVARDAG